MEMYLTTTDSIVRSRGNCVCVITGFLQFCLLTYTCSVIVHDCVMASEDFQTIFTFLIVGVGALYLFVEKVSLSFIDQLYISKPLILEIPIQGVADVVLEKKNYLMAFILCNYKILELAICCR